MQEIEYEKIKKQQNVHWWFSAKKEIVKALWQQYCHPSKEDRVLDAGCGYGFFMEALEDDCQVYGFDMSEDAVEWCQQKFGDHVKQGFLPSDIPFSDGTFNTIFALDVIEHIDRDDLALSSFNIKLADGGVLVLTVPSSMKLWSYNDAVCMHKRRYEREELMEKVQQAGFEVVKCSYYNSRLYTPIYIVRKLKNLFHVEKDDLPSEIKDDWINRTLFKIFVGEKEQLMTKDYSRGVSLILVARKMRHLE